MLLGCAAPMDSKYAMDIDAMVLTETNLPPCEYFQSVCSSECESSDDDADSVCGCVMNSEGSSRPRSDDMLLSAKVRGISGRRSLIGEGEFAQVFATEKVGYGEVAVKVFKVPVATRKEVRELKTVVHPNLVRIYGLATADSNAMVMELCGNNLHEVLHGTIGSFMPVVSQPLHRMLACLEVFKGLEYMHGKQILHRDVAAKRCFLGRGVCLDAKHLRPVKLGGFMTARRFQAKGMTRWTGSLSYMSPEEMTDGIASYGFPSDIYACGILLHECLSRSVPFSQYAESVVIAAAVAQGKRPPQEQVPVLENDVNGIRRELLELMEKCWHEDPTERPAIKMLRAKLQRLAFAWAACTGASMDAFGEDAEASSDEDGE